MAVKSTDCKYRFDGGVAMHEPRFADISHLIAVLHYQRRLAGCLFKNPRGYADASPRNFAASFLKSIGCASRSPEAIDRWSAARAVMSANFIRIGVAIASPNAMASRSAIEDRKAIVLAAETPAAARMIPLSNSLANRMANKVEHCDSTVGSSSDGRCVTMPSEAPYFRPSFAI